MVIYFSDETSPPLIITAIERYMRQAAVLGKDSARKKCFNLKNFPTLKIYSYSSYRIQPDKILLEKISSSNRFWYNIEK